MNNRDIFNRFASVNEHTQITMLGAFTISKSRRSLYFHIAKTGGSSIVKLLKNEGFDDGVLSDRSIRLEDKLEYFKEVADNWHDYCKFTFVRNKFSQMISLYHYDKSFLNKVSKNIEGGSDATFSDFIKNYVQPDAGVYGYWLDQYFLTKINDYDLYDFVGRFENYESDMRNVCKKLRIEYCGLSENIGNYNKSIDIKSYYNDELELILRKKYSDEFKHFNWELK